MCPLGKASKNTQPTSCLFKQPVGSLDPVVKLMWSSLLGGAKHWLYMRRSAGSFSQARPPRGRWELRKLKGRQFSVLSNLSLLVLLTFGEAGPESTWTLSPKYLILQQSECFRDCGLSCKIQPSLLYCCRWSSQRRELESGSWLKGWNWEVDSKVEIGERENPTGWHTACTALWQWILCKTSRHVFWDLLMNAYDCSLGRRLDRSC